MTWRDRSRHASLSVASCGQHRRQLVRGVRARMSMNSDRRAESPTPRLSMLGTAVGLVRIGAGIALGGRPRSFLRWENAVPPESSMTLLMRTVGIRDLAIGLGTVFTARSGSADDL